MFTIPWDVKEPTHYSKRVAHEVPGVVTVLCESTAVPHQLIAAKKLNLLNQIKEEERLQMLGWINIGIQRIMHKCILVYKCLNNLVPPLFL